MTLKCSSLDIATALFMLIFGFGVAAIPFAYAFSYGFTNAHSAFLFLTIGSLLFGLIMNAILSGANVIQLIHEEKGTISWYLVHFAIPICRIVPIFSFLFGYAKVNLVNTFAQICNSSSSPDAMKQMCASFDVKDKHPLKACCPGKCGDFCIVNQNAFSLHDKMGAGVELMYLLVVGVLFMVGIIVYESKSRSDIEFLFHICISTSTRVQIQVDKTFGPPWKSTFC